jgi:hypothetical protein
VTLGMSSRVGKGARVDILSIILTLINRGIPCDFAIKNITDFINDDISKNTLVDMLGSYSYLSNKLLLKIVDMLKNYKAYRESLVENNNNNNGNGGTPPPGGEGGGRSRKLKNQRRKTRKNRNSRS